MKKIMNLAVAVIMMTLCAGMVSCTTASDAGELPEPIPTKPDPTPTNPTPDPTTPDTITWKTIGGKTLSEDEDRKVTSVILGLDWKGDSISRVLQYILGAELTGPDYVLTMSKEATVYTGTSGLPKSEYGEYEAKKNNSYTDSLRVVTTTNGYKSNYYSLSLRTERTEGFTLINGKWEVYKNAVETATFRELSLYKDAYEVVRNDSVFSREEVKNVVAVKFHEHTYLVEKKVIVDHFVKIKEEQPAEPEKVKADYWVDGLGRLVSLTRGIREDSRNPCDFALFEGSKGYTIIIDTYSTEGKYLSTGTEFHSFDECPKSNDYDGVAYIKGHFYPGAITYDYSSKGTHDWVVTCYINGNVEQQGIKGQDAVARGIKNFKENNSAYPWPYLTNMSTSKEVNGKKVITVNGKTSEGRAVMKHVVADSSLK